MQSKEQLQHLAGLLLDMKGIRDQMPWGSSERRTMDIALQYVYSDRAGSQSGEFNDIYEEVKNNRADFAAEQKMLEED